MSADWQSPIGTRNYFSGSKYQGEFRDGQRHGQGTKEWKNGNRCAWLGRFRG